MLLLLPAHTRQCVTSAKGAGNGPDSELTRHPRTYRVTRMRLPRCKLRPNWTDAVCNSMRMMRCKIYYPGGAGSGGAPCGIAGPTRRHAANNIYSRRWRQNVDSLLTDVDRAIKIGTGRERGGVTFRCSESRVTDGVVQEVEIRSEGKAV